MSINLLALPSSVESPDHTVYSKFIFDTAEMQTNPCEGCTCLPRTIRNTQRFAADYEPLPDNIASLEIYVCFYKQVNYLPHIVTR